MFYIVWDMRGIGISWIER